MPAAAAALAFGGLYAYKIRKYKRELRKLSSEMDRILHGSEELVLSSYREGDIAILRDEIYKMTVRLREQSERLSEDKGALADALADISHQIRTPGAERAAVPGDEPDARADRMADYRSS